MEEKDQEKEIKIHVVVEVLQEETAQAEAEALLQEETEAQALLQEDAEVLIVII